MKQDTDAIALVCDELGNIQNEKVSEITKIMSQITKELFVKLFEEGMTLLEARALVDYLVTEVHTTAVLEIMQKQLQVKWEHDERNSEA